MIRFTRTSVLLFALAAVSACGGGFQARKFATNPALFNAGLKELKKKKWDNAVIAFERLTLDLSARDSLLPPYQRRPMLPRRLRSA